MGCWYVRSFETKFSDGKEPPSSDMVAKRLQNALSLSRDGSGDGWACAADNAAARITADATRCSKAIMESSMEGASSPV